jgi:hypothetical protein
MNKVKIYEVKSGASNNASKLFSEENSYFYWNSKKFSNNKIGDLIYFINRSGGWALFTKLDKINIPASFNSDNEESSFEDNNRKFSVDDRDGKFDNFYRFEIIEKVNIPNDWNWQTQLGNSETFDLWKENIKTPPNRIEKIDDLEKIFSKGEAYETLEKVRNLLSENNDSVHNNLLNEDIQNAIRSKEIQDLLNEETFHFEKAQIKLKEFDSYIEPKAEMYEDLYKRFEGKYKTYKKVIDKLDHESAEYEFLILAAQLVSYCDMNAADKKKLNDYDDNRTLARAFVRQTSWMKSLILYKKNKNDIESLTPSILNAIEYLRNPGNELTMLSENQRNMVSRYMLNIKLYNKNLFVSEVIKYFSPYRIKPENMFNHTYIISKILYGFPKVKEIWLKKLGGLVASGCDEWKEEVIEGFNGKDKVVIRWDKSPTGGKKIKKLLRETLENTENPYFYIYYVKDNNANYRSRVIDFSTEDDYETKEWNKNNDVARFKDRFSEYSYKKENNKDFKTKIVFLTDEFIQLEEPIPIEDFEFYENYKPPTQNNLQPFTEFDTEIIEESKTKYTSMNPIHYAIKTKPFIILAGLSGTGKSRLARTLAFQTCSKEKLSENELKPGNFELIPVRPNWHDSSDLMGYISRINGEKYIATSFLKFIAKAWLNPELPFILCLDEMNLAPVEQYFAEYLSIIETRKNINGLVTTDFLIPKENFDNKDLYFELLKELGLEGDNRFENGISIPSNLIVIGTVNMDETSHSFSRKVLDRAMTIEMNEINLLTGLLEEETDWKYPEVFLSKDRIIGKFTAGSEVTNNGLFPEYKDVIAFLENINTELESTPFKIAYRVRDEFLIYCYYSFLENNDNKDWLEKALDQLTTMKILSRIEGDENKLRGNSKSENVLLRLKKHLNENFKLTNAKLDEMILRLENSGYTSYWS